MISGQKRRSWLTPAAWLIGVVCLWLLARNTDSTEFWSALRSLKMWQVAAIVVLSTTSRVFQGLRFSALYSAGQPRWRGISQSFAIRAGNLVLPLRAGEALRLLFLRDAEPAVPFATHLAWTVMEKFVEFLGFLIFASLAWYVVHADLRFTSLEVNSALGPWTPLVCLCLLLGSLWVPQVRVWLRVLPTLSSFGTSFTWGLLFWLCNWGIFAIVCQDPWLGFPLMMSSSLGAALPGLPGGLGPFQAAYVGVAQIAGIPYETALAQAVAAHVLQFPATLLIGLPALWFETRPARASARQAKLMSLGSET